MELSPQQKAVIQFARNKTGSLNLLACAGTGKTTTLEKTVEELTGVTWLCAFNSPIAGELDHRIKMNPRIDQGSIRVSTVHSGGCRAWMKFMGRKPVGKADKYKVRNIVEGYAEKNDLYIRYGSVIVRLVEYGKAAGFGVLQRINSVGNWEDLVDHFGLEIESDENGRTPWDSIISASIKVYNDSLKLCLTGPKDHNIDFSDMLLAPLYYKATFPKYDNILIDEAQDISPLRLKLILSCLKPGGRVIAVGDPNQAIYGFTGADAESMDTIKQHTSAIELPLTVTYRCPKAVVALAQQWVPRITAHETAPEGMVMTVPLAAKDPAVQQIGFWDCGPYTANDAVLCRNTKPLVELAYQFLRRQIPCMVEGRDIGQGLIKLATRWKIETLIDLELKLEDWKTKEMAKFIKLSQEGKAEQVEDQADTLACLIAATKDQGKDMIQDLVDLINRMFGDTLEGQKPKCIIFSTVHKSKGREWPRVFLLGRNRYMPSKWAKKKWEQDQEKNLMYVAVTRAQKELIEVTVPMK